MTGDNVQALATIERCIATYQDELLGFLARRAPEDYEAIAQETWLRVFKSNAVFENEKACRAYAYTVARRLLIDGYRKRAKQHPMVSLSDQVELPTDRSDPQAIASAGELLVLVEEVLKQMSPKISEVFRLRTTTPMSFKEIAERQGVGLNTALGRMHNATQKLTAALIDAGFYPTGGE